VDWTEWKISAAVQKRGKKAFLISTEMAIVSGADHISRARGRSRDASTCSPTTCGAPITSTSEPLRASILAADLQGHSRRSDQTMNFLHMQMVARPQVSPDIALANGNKNRWDPFGLTGWIELHAGVQTMAYYNTVQNYEAADFRETRQPDADSVAQVFDRRDATVVGMYLTKPVGFKTYTVKTDIPSPFRICSA